MLRKSKHILTVIAAEVSVSVCPHFYGYCHGKYNTVAIVMAALLRAILVKNSILSPRQTASLLDTFSVLVRVLFLTAHNFLLQLSIAKISAVAIYAILVLSVLALRVRGYCYSCAA